MVTNQRTEPKLANCQTSIDITTNHMEMGIEVMHSKELIITRTKESLGIQGACTSSHRRDPLDKSITMIHRELRGDNPLLQLVTSHREFWKGHHLPHTILLLFQTWRLVQEVTLHCKPIIVH